MKNWNSSRNQEIKGQFVEREVVACASQLVYELSGNDAYMDLINDEFYSIPDFGQMLDNVYNELEYEETIEVLEHYEVEHLSEIGEATEEEIVNYITTNYSVNGDFEYLEPMEFWIVSPWLGRKLKEYGEIVSFDFFGFTIWGRCATGQAILLDGVISRICEELEMLEK